MTRSQALSPVLVAVVVAIGCGSGLPAPSEARQAGKPQEASATTQRRESPDSLQVAQAQQAAQPAPGAPAKAGGGSATIKGTVRFSGAAPEREKVKMDADPACQQQHQEPVLTEEVAVNDNNTLRHVFVYVKEGLPGPVPAPTEPVTLDQAGCWYQPHVFGIQVNQPLEIVNSDPTLHNVNAKPAKNPPFNIAQPVKGMKSAKKFAKPEIGVKFKCNVHPWMSAYAGVVEHPYFAVSGEDGSFAIPNLPAGTYVLEAWHERYGTQTQSVTVGEGDTQSIEFSFTGQ